MNDPDGQIAIGCMDVHSIKQQSVLPNLKNSIENHLAIIVACIFAVVFLSIALAHGFSMKSIFGSSDMLISANVAKNIFDFVYLVTAIGVVAISLLGENVSVKFMQAVGKVYVLAAFIGFMRFGDLQNYSEWGDIINLGLGAALFAAGSFLQDYRHKLLVSRLIAKQRQPSSYKIMDKIKGASLGTVLEGQKGINGIRRYCKESSEIHFIRGKFV